MIQTIPEFDAAVQRLRSFLAELGHPPGDPTWVFREDVSTRRKRDIDQDPLPSDNERIAKDPCGPASRMGIGVCLDVFCQLGPSDPWRP